MPANENSSHKSSNVYESNIPILKKNRINSSRKLKVKQFPDLQKYIDTILSASRDCDDDDSSIPEKNAKSSDLDKSKKCQKSNRSKNINKLNAINDKESGSCEKVKLKSKLKASETLNKFSSKSVFQRKELDVDKKINDFKENKMDPSPSLEIEKFLKKLYPNPYHLDEDRSSRNCENSSLIHSTNITPQMNDDEKKSSSILEDVKKPILKSDESTSLITLTNGSDSNESGLVAAEGSKNNKIIHNVEIKSKSTTENRQQTMRNLIDPRTQKTSQNKLIRHSKNPNEYDLSKLKMYRKDSLSVSKFDKKEINLHLEMSDLNNSGRSETKVGVRSIQMNRDISVSKTLNSDRLKKRKNSTEVKKLYELMDKTTESLLVITTRNEKEVSAEKERKKTNLKPRAIHHQFENNKFIEFIKNMNKEKEEKLNEKNDLNTPNCESENYVIQKLDFIDSSKNSPLEIKKNKKNSSSLQSEEKKKIKVKNDCFKTKKNNIMKILPHSSSTQIEPSFTTMIFKEASKTSLDQAIKNYYSKDIYNINSNSNIKKNNDKKSVSLYNIDPNFNNPLLEANLEFVKLNPKINKVLECIQEYLEKFDGDQKNQFGHKMAQCEKFTKGSEPVMSLKKTENNKTKLKSKEKINVRDKNFKISNICIQHKNNNSEENEKRLISDWKITEIKDHTIEMKTFGTKSIESRMRHCVKSQSNFLKSRLTSLNGRDYQTTPWYSTPNCTRAVSSLPDLEQQTVSQNVVNEPVDNNFHTVEENNELGGYSEGKPEDTILESENLCFSKNLLPLSFRIRKSKKSSSKALKKALESEEKLLINRFADVNEPAQSNQILVKSSSKNTKFFLSDDDKSHESTDSTEPTLFFRTFKSGIFDSYGLLKTFKNHNSNFVICVNSLPRNIRRPNLIFSSPLTLKAISHQESKNMNETSQISEFLLHKIYFSPHVAHTTLVCDLKKERLFLNVPRKVLIFCTAASLCSHAIVGFSKWEENISLNGSENRIDYKKSRAEASAFPMESVTILKPAEILFDNFKEQRHEYLSMTLNSLSDLIYGDEKSQALSSVSDVENELGKDAKGVNYSNESNLDLHSYSPEIPQPSSDKTEKTSVCNNDLNQKLNVELGDNNRNLIQNLLIRTHNLQQKLRQYLHQTYSSSSNTFLNENSFSDLCLLYDNKTDFGNFPFTSNIKSVNSIQIDSKSMQTEETHPLVYWCAKSNANFISSNCFSNAETHVASEIRKVDHSTSYDSDIRKICESTAENKHLSVRNKSLTFDSEYEDLFSSSSFKSDFSECEKASEVKKSDTYKLSDIKNLKLFNKIYRDLELWRQSHKSNLDLLRNDKNKMMKRSTDNKNFDAAKVVERVTESPEKLLTTVFKGKNSMTELEIDLNDVPITKVSVEKKKFSSNHTKISVCLSNETPDCLAKSELSDSNLKTSGYSKDSIASQKNFKKLNNCLENVSDDDEDDFKSVASSLGCISDIETSDGLRKAEIKTVTKEPEPVVSKSYKKNFFYFNRGNTNDFNVEKKKVVSRFNGKDNLCRELKPIKEGLKDVQIQRRSADGNPLLKSDEYYDRALKLAKMSAGYCQSCGSRAVIPEDTFGYYKSILPRRYSSHHLKYYLTNNASANSEFYSFRSSTQLNDHLCDFDLNNSSSYLINSQINDPVLKRSLNSLSFD